MFYELQSLHRSLSPHILLCLFHSVLPFLLIEKLKAKKKKRKKDDAGIDEQERKNSTQWPEQNLFFLFLPFPWTH